MAEIDLTKSLSAMTEFLARMQERSKARMQEQIAFAKEVGGTQIARKYSGLFKEAKSEDELFKLSQDMLAETTQLGRPDLGQNLAQQAELKAKFLGKQEGEKVARNTFDELFTTYKDRDIEYNGTIMKGGQVVEDMKKKYGDDVYKYTEALGKIFNEGVVVTNEVVNPNPKKPYQYILKRTKENKAGMKVDEYLDIHNVNGKTFIEADNVPGYSEGDKLYDLAGKTGYMESYGFFDQQDRQNRAEARAMASEYREQVRFEESLKPHEVIGVAMMDIGDTKKGEPIKVYVDKSTGGMFIKTKEGDIIKGLSQKQIMTYDEIRTRSSDIEKSIVSSSAGWGEKYKALIAKKDESDFNNEVAKTFIKMVKNIDKDKNIALVFRELWYGLGRDAKNELRNQGINLDATHQLYYNQKEEYQKYLTQ